MIHSGGKTLRETGDRPEQTHSHPLVKMDMLLSRHTKAVPRAQESNPPSARISYLNIVSVLLYRRVSGCLPSDQGLRGSTHAGEGTAGSQVARKMSTVN